MMIKNDELWEGCKLVDEEDLSVDSSRITIRDCAFTNIHWFANEFTLSNSKIQTTLFEDCHSIGPHWVNCQIEELTIKKGTFAYWTLEKCVARGLVINNAATQSWKAIGSKIEIAVIAGRSDAAGFSATECDLLMFYDVKTFEVGRFSLESCKGCVFFTRNSLPRVLRNESPFVKYYFLSEEQMEEFPMSPTKRIIAQKTWLSKGDYLGAKKLSLKAGEVYSLKDLEKLI